MKQKTAILLLAILMMAMFTSAWADTISIGSGTATSYNMPITTYYGYSYSQQLFTPAQVTMAGDITKLRFYFSSGGNTNSSAWVVYMGHTTKTAFSTSADWVPLANMTQVFNGTVTIPASAAWMEITLSSSFPYNNSDNLVIAVDENTASYAASNGSWGVFTSTANSTIYYRDDSTNPNPASPPTAYGRLATPNRIQLDISPAAGVANPTGFTATPISDTQINLAWTLNANSDNVMVARNTVNTFGVPSGTYSVNDEISGGGTVLYNSNGTSYNDTGRAENTTYYYKAWSVNGGVPTYSSGATASATTMLSPIATFPWTETFETDSTTRGGWSQIQEQGAKLWTYATGAGSGVITTAHAGTLNARFTGSSYAGDKTKLVTPLLDLSAKTNYNLSFWYGQELWSPDQNELRVFYRTNPSASWVEIASYTGNVPTWTQEPGLVLPNPSATYQIAFEGKDLYGYPNVLDDVVVDAVSAEPVFAVSPALKAFGSQQIGTSSAAQVFTIKNNGGGTLKISGVAKGGANAADFDLTDVNDYTGGKDLAGGESITVSVEFSPETIGAKVATLTITHDQAGSPAVVDLTGTGSDTTIREIPYIQTWDVPTLVDGWVIYNVNADAVSWGLTLDGSNAAVIGYNGTLAMDDWLISPPVVLTGGTTYTVTYKYRAASATYPENMKLAFGTAQNPAGMTDVIADHVEFINSAYLTGTGTYTPSTSGSYYLGVHGYSDANMYNIYIDDIRILLPNTSVGQVISTGATASVTLPALTVGAQQISPSVAFSGLTGNPVIQVSALSNVALGRLELTIDGGDLGGVTVTFTHGLGFIPLALAYQIGNGSLMVIDNPGDWSETTAYFTVPDGKGPLSLKVIFPKDKDDTLPVNLSSFTATITTDLMVKIAWLAESETNHSGYNLMRAETTELNGAIKINPELISDGSVLGTQISYSYTDYEAYSNMQYYYWLESVALDGSSEFYGPLSITIGDPTQDPLPPVTPLATKLMNAYPNPFNPNTNIRYSLKEAGQVSIDVYNMKGQKVRSFQAVHNVPGYYQVAWDGRDASGNSVASGVYMYRMNSGKYTSSKKMILAK